VLPALLLLTLLSACSFHRAQIAQARPVLSAASDAFTYSLNVAVGKDGSHHLVFSEAPERQYGHLVYAYQKLGETPRQWVIAPAEPHHGYDSPDVAVTDSGKVFLLWHESDHSANQAWTCWGSFSPQDTTPPACHRLGNIPTNTVEPLVLAADGETVYAVYTVSDSGHHNLRASQIYPTVDSDPYADLITGDEHTFYGIPVIQVGTDRRLHIAETYTVSTGSPAVTIYHGQYIQYTAGVGLSTTTALDEDAAHSLTNPALTLVRDADAGDTAFYAFGIKPIPFDGSESCAVKVYRRNPDGVTVDSFSPLDPAKAWFLPGAPALAASNASSVTLFFTAMNSDTAGKSDLFSVSADEDSAAATNLTNSDVTESRPLAAEAFQPDQDGSGLILSSPVVFFRRMWTNGHYSDALFYDQATSLGQGQVRVAYDGPDTNTSTQMDLAVNGDSVFAAWVDYASPTDLRLVPWITYNADQIFLPAVVKSNP
jgi:hypothetical protein